MPKPLKPVRQRDLVRSLAEVLIQSGVTVEESVAQFHRAVLEAALEEAAGNQVEAAKRQRMPRTTLRNQMISTGMLRAPKPLADQSTGLPQAQTDTSERFPPPAPGLLLPLDEKDTQ